MQLVPATPRYEIGKYDQIILPDGRIYTCPRTLHDHYVLVQVGSNIAQEIGFAEFEELRRSPAFQHRRHYYTRAHAEARVRSGVSSMLDLPREELSKVLFDEACVEALIDLHAAGETTIDDAAIARVLPEIKRRVKATGLHRHAAIVGDSGGKSGGNVSRVRHRYTTVVSEFKFPRARALRRKYHDYVTCGCLAYALRDRLRHCGNRTPRKAPVVLALMHEHVHSYMSETRPTQAICYQAFCDALKELNFKPAPGEDPEAYRVSFTTFSAAVRALPKFETCVARRGLPYALRRFKAVVETFGSHRIGELVQIDEWQVSLLTLCVKSGIWEHMTRAERRMVRRRRCWLTVIIDVASRCIPAMRLSRSVTTESTLLTLRMMLNDKTHLAQAAGCRTPWDYSLLPLTLRNDTAPVYNSDRTKAALADLGIVNVAPPAGMPELRPHIERLFGSIRTQALGYFCGQTFANATDKGDYDAEARASLTIDQLCELLVLWFVDVYHNTPHEGLGNQTPRQRWLELESRYKRGTVPPGRHDQRAIFGITVQRTLNSRGLRFMGLYYHAPVLERLWRDHGEVELDVRVDQEDLGWISVRIGPEWHHARCTTPGFDGVPILRWQRDVKAARLETGPGANGEAEVVETALRRIRTMADEAHALAELSDVVLNPKRLQWIERTNIRAMEVFDDEQSAPAVPGDLGGGIPVTGPTPADPPEAASPPADPAENAETPDEDNPSLWRVRRPR